jgi:hypothetical protein
MQTQIIVTNETIQIWDLICSGNCLNEEYLNVACKTICKLQGTFNKNLEFLHIIL